MDKNINRITLDEAVKDEDFKVISNVVQINDGSYQVYKEGMDLSNAIAGGETPFPNGIDHVWEITDGEIDVELAVKLALGVIEDLDTGKRFLYHADGVGENRKKKEYLRLGIYYQLTHPEYDDRKLDVLIQQVGGKDFLKQLLLVNDDSIFTRLHEISNKFKGTGGNIAEFRRKDV